MRRPWPTLGRSATEKKNCADTKQIYGGEVEPDDFRRPILLIKTGMEGEESSSVVSDV
jgi:hypothetical protein